MNKKLIIAIGALAAVIGLLLGVYFATRPQPQVGEKSITVTVVHKDGSENVLHYCTDREYLADVLLDNKLVEGNMAQFGLEIFVVDGEEASWEKDQAYWSIEVDGEYANTGASGIPVTDGSVYKLIYTK